jgi:N-acetylneuraminic acid mutarotase
VVVGDRLWVVGGMTGERGNKLSSTEVYDPVEDQWSMGPAMPTARSSLAAAELDGVVYALGGSGVDPTLDVAEALDTAAGEWRRIAPVPTARYEHGAVTLDGKIYVVGGSVDSGGPRAVPTPTVEIYDPATDTWSAGPPLAVARTSLRTVVVDGVVYAAGGIDADGQPSTVVEVLDPAVGSWQLGPAMPEPMFNFGYAAYQGEIHAIYHRQHLVLDPAAGEWRVEPPPTLSRHGQGMIEFDGVLFAIGGCTEEPLVDINTVQVWQG